MKKILALVIGLLLIVPMATVVSAASTTLTMVVPEAEYTLVIPKNQQISYRSKGEVLGGVSVKDTAGFSEGKDLEVTVTAAPFTCSTTDTELSYTLSAQQATAGGKEFELGTNFRIVFQGKSDGSLDTLSKVITKSSGAQSFDVLEIDFNDADWDDLKPGEYTATITFKAKVVENALGE